MQRVRFAHVVCSGVAAAAVALIMAAGASASELPKLTLTVTKQNIKVGGQLVSGAVDIATTVKGEPEDNPTLFHLKPGVTAEQFLKFASHLGENSDFDAADALGTLVFSGADSPGNQTTHAFVDLPAGNYLALNNGNGHTAFTVTQSSSPASLPKSQATVTSIEFGFRGPTTLHDGELVSFHNEGHLIHMFQAAQVANTENATLAEAQLQAGNTNAAKQYVTAPLMMLAGPLSSGARQESVISAPPGVYVMFCSMNTQDGREHFQLGMYRTITIVK